MKIDTSGEGNRYARCVDNVEQLAGNQEVTASILVIVKFLLSVENSAGVLKHKLPNILHNVSYTVCFR